MYRFDLDQHFVCFQNMVMNFRVSELQVLLGFAGWNKNGRKNEHCGMGHLKN